MKKFEEQWWREMLGRVVILYIFFSFDTNPLKGLCQNIWKQRVQLLNHVFLYTTHFTYLSHSLPTQTSISLMWVGWHYYFSHCIFHTNDKKALMQTFSILWATNASAAENNNHISQNWIFSYSPKTLFVVGKI